MKSKLSTGLAGLLAGLAVAIALSLPASAEIDSDHAMSPDHTLSTPQFQHIEQPVALKVAVTAAGLALIGLELWWFRFSKAHSTR